MSFVNQARTKRLLLIHGWSGIVLGLLLYTVVLTGAVAVFAEEIGGWSVSGAPNKKGITQPIDSIIRDLARTVPDEFKDDVGVYAIEDGSLSVYFHTHGTTDAGELKDKGVRFLVDGANGSVLSRFEGWSDEVFGKEQKSALRKFLVDLHVQLYLPSFWGLLLTGTLGLSMMVAAVSGLIMHRHIIKDIFVAPRPGNLLLLARDRHILSGTWGLPFAFLLAFTGSFLSFAFSVGIPIVSKSAFGGDQMLVNEILNGAPPVEDKTPATLTNLDAAIGHGMKANGATPVYLEVSHFGRADAGIGIYFEAPDGDLSYQQYTYNGVSGHFDGIKPGLGTQPSAGAAAYTILSALHYGNFGGLFSKIAWFSLGIASCYVIISGLRLWFQRRSEDAIWARASRVVPALEFGLPLSMLMSAHFYFQTIARTDATYWTPAGFFLTLGAVFVTGLMSKTPQILRRRLEIATALAAVALPGMRLLSGGRGWGAALAIDEPLVVTLDLLLLGTAVVLACRIWQAPISELLWKAVVTSTRARAEPAE